MEFFMTKNGAPVNVVRPNNNGIALKMFGDSYAGLTFYGSNRNKIVDKPTRLVANYTYASAQEQTRKKAIEIENGGYANWVDGSNPDTVQGGSVFFIAGNQFKYAHVGYDQAVNQYTTNSRHNALAAGNFYNRFPTDDSPPVFMTDPSQNSITSTPDNIGEPGPPQRYRRALFSSDSGGIYQTSSNIALTNGYLNTTPEKIAYMQFDLSNFPVDTIINQAVLEVYFASGFTIKQGTTTNFELNNNRAWQKSRLSGNGVTTLKTLTDPIAGTYTVQQPAQNVHWRKNFFEIAIPYAFSSEPTDQSYGIRNLFTTTPSNTLPAPQNPQPNLEYLGYINIDELNTAPTSSGGEVSVGLTNIILSTSSIIYQINGVLQFQTNGDATVLANSLNTVLGTISASGIVIGNYIAQTDVLPNMKILVYPFGIDTIQDQQTFFYGYAKSLLPANLIGFSAGDIAVYKQVLNYVQPLYSSYSVNLLEADTYFAYSTFSSSPFDNTIRDISY